MIIDTIDVVDRHVLELCCDERIYCMAQNKIILNTMDRPMSHDLALVKHQHPPAESAGVKTSRETV